LVDEEARQERPERERWPRRLGERRGAEGDRERDQQEELVVARLGHAGEEPRQDATGEQKEREQDRRGRREGLPHRKDVAAVQAAEDRDEHDQDQEGRVIDERGTDHTSLWSRAEHAS